MSFNAVEMFCGSLCFMSVVFYVRGLMARGNESAACFGAAWVFSAFFIGIMPMPDADWNDRLFVIVFFTLFFSAIGLIYKRARLPTSASDRKIALLSLAISTAVIFAAWFATGG